GQQNHDKQAGHGNRFPQLPMAGAVDFADDRVVPNVLLDGVLEGFSHYATRSAARSLALRARGLASSSASFAITGFFVSTVTVAPVPRRCSRARSVCLTTRSSSE